jgi:hypothetical protein
MILQHKPLVLIALSQHRDSSAVHDSVHLTARLRAGCYQGDALPAVSTLWPAADSSVLGEGRLTAPSAPC